MYKWIYFCLIFISGMFSHAAEAQYDPEALFWDSIVCSDEKEVRVYLKNYPEGAHLEAANRCLEDIAVMKRLSLCEAHIEARRLAGGASGNALECYQSVLERDPENVEAQEGLNRIEDIYVSWAQQALEAGQLDQARRELEDLRHLNPRHRDIRNLEAAIARVERARTQLSQCAAYFDVDRLVEGDGENAVACYRSVLEQDSKNAEALEGLNRIADDYAQSVREALNNGEFNIARTNLDALRDVNAEHRDLQALEDSISTMAQTQRLLIQCKSYFEEGRIIEGEGASATKCYRLVLAHDPGNIEAREGLNRIEDDYVRRVQEALQSGRIEQARRELEGLRTLDPKHRELATLETSIAEMEDVRRNLSRCASLLEAGRLIDGEDGNAIECYQLVLARDPGNVEARKRLNQIADDFARQAQNALDEGELDATRGYLDALRNLNPDHQNLQALQTALQEAEDLNQLSETGIALSRLLGRDFSSTTRDENGWTDLHYAAAFNLPKLARALLIAGADVNAEIKDDGRRFSDQLKETLRKIGDNYDYDNWRRYGQSPLHFAAWQNFVEVARELLDHSADVNAQDEQGWTPLHLAAWKDAHSVVVSLLEHGANVNARDNDGVTLLHVAAWNNAEEVAQVLLRSGANTNATDNNGWMPLHLAARYNSLEVAVALIAGDADLNAKDNGGDTALHEAAQKNARKVAEKLIEHGANINARDHDGETPLDRALIEEAIDVQNLLRRNGGQCNRTSC